MNQEKKHKKVRRKTQINIISIKGGQIKKKRGKTSIVCFKYNPRIPAIQTIKPNTGGQ